jgi:hypothetical protein
MANIGKWGDLASPVTLLSTELNALANNAAGAASSAIANHTNLDVYADIELVLGVLGPVAPNYCTLYILEAIDGSNYPSATATILRNQPSQILCTFPLDTTAATAQRVVVRNVVLPPGSFKVVLDNQSGDTLAATGNTVKMITYNVDLNG